MSCRTKKQNTPAKKDICLSYRNKTKTAKWLSACLTETNSSQNAKIAICVSYRNKKQQPKCHIAIYVSYRNKKQKYSTYLDNSMRRAVDRLRRVRFLTCWRRVCRNKKKLRTSQSTCGDQMSRVGFLTSWRRVMQKTNTKYLHSQSACGDRMSHVGFPEVLGACLT